MNGAGIPPPRSLPQEVDLKCNSCRFLINFALILFLFFAIDFPVSGETTMKSIWETDLSDYGNVYEVNASPDGFLWISDNGSGEIRSYQPSSNMMTVYGGLGKVSDARPDAQGHIWFVDQDTDQLGKLNPSSGDILYWQLGDSISPFGTAIDSQNRIWMSLSNNSNLYRFTPGVGNEGSLCTLDLSGSGFNGSYYVVDESGTVWLGGINQVHRLVELSENQYQLVEYTPSGSLTFSAEGLLGDGDGGLWFADSSANKAILHLDLSSDASFKQYAIPRGIPYMLTRQNDLIWFSGQEPGVLGSLDPASLTPIVNSINVTISTLEPACVPITATSGSSTKTSETPIWVESSYPMETTTGWSVIDLGSGSYPWGIAISNGNLWVVDQGRQVLMRTAVEATITACKYSDADGELTTTDDRAPLAGWGMTLYQDDVWLGTQLTGENGCTSWSELPLGASYRVQEAAQEGWAALEPADSICDLGNITQVGQYDCDFINWKEESNIFLPLVIK